MSERLTEEQVAEALEVVRDWTDVHTCNDEGECSSCGADWPCQKGLVTPMVLQVSADLSAAKEREERAEEERYDCPACGGTCNQVYQDGGCTDCYSQGTVTGALNFVASQLEQAEAKLSALQEAARAAVETESQLQREHDPDKHRCLRLDHERALSTLRELLEGEK